MSKVQQYWGQAVMASLDRPPALNFSLSLSISIILAWDFQTFLENENKKMKLKIQTNKTEIKPMSWCPKTQVSPWCCCLFPSSPHPIPSSLCPPVPPSLLPGQGPAPNTSDVAIGVSCPAAMCVCGSNRGETVNFSLWHPLISTKPLIFAVSLSEVSSRPFCHAGWNSPQAQKPQVGQTEGQGHKSNSFWKSG